MFVAVTLRSEDLSYMVNDLRPVASASAASVLSNSLVTPFHIVTFSRGLSFIHHSQSIIKYSIMRNLFEPSRSAENLL